MPRKAAAPQPKPGPSTSDDEWEEQIMIAQIDGVLDAQIFRDAVEAGNVAIRRPGTSEPVIQVSNSLYTGHWTKALGTHIVLQAENQQLKVLSVNQRMLKTEKALLKQVPRGPTDGTAAAAAGSSTAHAKVAPK
ncbi:hypothetical protein PFISCL1PPCAC_18305, partial [Pristionchus fissidentatus]